MVGQLADMSLCVADNNAFCLPIGSIGILLYYLLAERSFVAVKVKLWAHVPSFVKCTIFSLDRLMLATLYICRLLKAAGNLAGKE